MPIRPENLARYPDDWQRIRGEILERARFCCEWCGKPNGADVEVLECGAWRLPGGLETHHPDPELPERWAQLERPRYHRQRLDMEWASARLVRVVLTVAHLDHVPEHCEPRNLRALCQRCHNRYDTPHRVRSRRAQARKASD